MGPGLLGLVFLGIGWTGSGPEPQLRLDHAVIAVRDLDSATATYGTDLGFSIKPGRPHPNGLRNRHIKFRDGSALELITVLEPQDDLAREYADFLETADGAAFLSLSGGPIAGPAEVVRALGMPATEVGGSYYEWLVFPPGHALHYLFFIHLLSQAVDEERHLRHANTAVGLASVWVTEPAAGAASQLLAELGARRCAAGAVSESTVEGVRFVGQIGLDSGTLLAVPVEAALEPGRPIVGATILVTDVQAAKRFASVPPGRQPAVEQDWRGRFVRVPPSRAHGVWLEFLEPGANGQCAS